MKKITILMMTVCLCATTAIFATDGTWNVETAGDWSVVGNWTASTPADGAGSKAYFNNNFSGDWVGAPRAVNVDSARTIGEIYFGSAGFYWNYWSLTTSTITLDNSGSQPIISVNGIWASMIDSLAGTAGFNKTGADDLRLYAEQSISGPVTISAGTLGAYGNTALKNVDVDVNGGRLTIGGNVSASLNSLTVTTGNGDIGLIKPEAGQSATLNTPFTTSYADGGNTFVVNVDANSAITLNGNVTMNANTAFAISGNNGILNINAPISGAHSLRLMGRAGSADIGTYNINAACTYTGWTTLEAWGANPRYEIGVDQAFPAGGATTEFSLQVDNSSADTSVTLDLNDYSQTVNILWLKPDGAQSGHYVELTGNAGSVLTVNEKLNLGVHGNGAHAKITGGKVIVPATAGNTWLNSPVILTNATLVFNAPAYGAASTVIEVQEGGVVEGLYYSSLTVKDGGKVSPGNSIGTLAAAGDVIMEDGSEYDWEVGTASADLLNIAGDLDISAGGITVNVIDAGSPDGSALTLFTVSGTITGAGTDITMNYGAGVAGPANPTISGGVISAAVIPEPGIIGLLSLLGLAILRRK